MRTENKICISTVIIAAIWFSFLVLLGCYASSKVIGNDWLTSGFIDHEIFFQDLQNTKKDFVKEIKLENITIKIVSDKKHFEYYKNDPNVKGYAHRNGTIVILGKYIVVNGKNKLVVNQAVLGHEANHLLEYKDVDVLDPDVLTKGE